MLGLTRIPEFLLDEWWGKNLLFFFKSHVSRPQVKQHTAKYTEIRTECCNIKMQLCIVFMPSFMSQYINIVCNSCLAVAYLLFIWLLIRCLLVAYWLLIDCLLVAYWLLLDCFLVAHWLRIGCWLIGCWLLIGCNWFHIGCFGCLLLLYRLLNDFLLVAYWLQLFSYWLLWLLIGCLLVAIVFLFVALVAYWWLIGCLLIAYWLLIFPANITGCVTSKQTDVDGYLSGKQNWIGTSKQNWIGTFPANRTG